MWQTQWVKQLLEKIQPEISIQLCPITTQGDRQLSESLAHIGGKGVFIKEIEQALLENEIDLAVHSMKDVPTELPEGLIIAAIPERADARDAFVSRTETGLMDLPSESRIGTGSQRRKAQLLNLRSDLRILDIRGNVDTRLRKLVEGHYDGIILAAAGMIRLGRADEICELFSVEQMVPAVGQAAVGVECRSDDSEIRELLASIDHPSSSVAVTAERAFLAHFGGGCQQPIGAYARLDGADKIQMIGMVADEKGLRMEHMDGLVKESEEVGIRLAERIR